MRSPWQSSTTRSPRSSRPSPLWEDARLLMDWLVRFAERNARDRRSGQPTRAPNAATHAGSHTATPRTDHERSLVPCGTDHHADTSEGRRAPQARTIDLSSHRAATRAPSRAPSSRVVARPQNHTPVAARCLRTSSSITRARARRMNARFARAARFARSRSSS